MAIVDLPGYVQGFIFSDASTATYDAGVFKNQGPTGSNFGGLADVTITTGTPAFTTINGQKCLILDNTVHGGFVPALPWEMACITVMKPNMTVNGYIYPVIVGGAASIASNGSIRLRRSPNYQHWAVTPSGVAFITEDYSTSDAIKVTAFEFSQETRRSYSTRDGVTVTASAAVAATQNGNALAWGWQNGGAAGSIKARFGNLSGTIGDVALSTNTMILAELHFFKAGLLRDAGSLALLATEMAALKTKYGAT